MKIRTALAAVLAASLQTGGATSQTPQRLCGRVDSGTCAGPGAPVRLIVQLDGRRQFNVLIPAEHRPAFGPNIVGRYEQRTVCVTPRRIADQAAVVESPAELEITAEPDPPFPPLPDGVQNGCDVALETPEVRSDVKPRFPVEALFTQNHATVKMRVVINVDGTVGQVVVLKRVTPALDASAVDAVRQWRFRPAKVDGAPAASVVQIEISFSRR